MADLTTSSAIDTFMQAASQTAMLSALNITLGGHFTTSGAFTTTLTVTANTNVTLPTSGTLATLGANTFTGLNIFTSAIESHLGNNNGVVIGYGAGGSYLTNTSDQIAIGFQAGNSSTAAGSNSAVRIGRHAGYAAIGANQVCIGHAAGQYGYNSDNSVIIGYLAGVIPLVL